MNKSLGCGVISFVIAVVFCACTQVPAQQSPTQASLPNVSSAVASIASVTTAPTATEDTRLVTREAELNGTQRAISATQTALAQTPLPQATDCGAMVWWNYTGGSAIDFMDGLKELDPLLLNLTPVPNSPIGAYEYASSYAEVFDNIANLVAGRDYALCIKAGRDALVGAMDAYQDYTISRAFSLSEYSEVSSGYTPEDLAALLENARTLMRVAVAEIQRATGTDATFLLEDGIGS